jgi:hypothetical protein
MRYYPAFGVKSGPDALITRFLSAGNQVSEGIALGSGAYWGRFRSVSRASWTVWGFSVPVFSLMK